MRRWAVAVIVVLVVLGAAQYAIQRLGENALQRVIGQSQTWATISVGRARFWLWGVVELDHVAVKPTAWLSSFYGLTLGYNVRVDEIRVHHFVPGWNDGLVLDSVDVDARSVNIPMLPWRWTITVARNRRGQRMWAPTLTDLGVSSLVFDVSGTANFHAGFERPKLRLLARLPQQAEVALGCALVVPRSVAADPGGLAIDHCRLDYRDRGLMQHFEAMMAQHNKVSVANLQTAIAEQIGLDSARAQWSYLSRQALQTFVHTPGRLLRLEVEPPKPLPLEQIPRGIWSGLPNFIGLKASLPAHSVSLSR